MIVHINCPCGAYRNLEKINAVNADEIKAVARRIGWSHPRLQHSPDLRARGVIAVAAVCPECQDLKTK